MKRLFGIALMCTAMAASTMATSCKKDDPEPPVTPEFEITIDAANGTAKALLNGVEVSLAKEGDVITVEATPADDYVFAGWTSTPSVTFADAAVATTTFTMPAEKVALTAAFVGTNTLNFTATQAGGAVEVKVDGVAIASGDRVEAGRSVSIKATANAGYDFTGWTGVTIADPTAAEASFEMPAEAVVLTAGFTAIPYAITIVEPVNGSIEVRVNAGEPIVSGSEFPVGAEVYIKASADEDYLFMGWNIAGVEGTFDQREHTFAMPAGALTIEASFELDASSDYVRIAGVKWAKYNVGAAGTFVQNVQDTGKYYQFNFNTAWSSDGTPDPAGATWIASWKDGSTVINNNFGTGPCPANYTVPTEAQWRSLMAASTMSDATVNEVAGKKFVADGKELFFPYAGYMGPSQYSPGTAPVSLGTIGTYWSNEYVNWSGQPGPPAYAKAFQSHLKANVTTSGTGTLTVKEIRVAVGDVIESTSQVVAVITSNGTTDFNITSSYMGKVAEIPVNAGDTYTSGDPIVKIEGHFASNQARFNALPVRCVGVE